MAAETITTSASETNENGRVLDGLRAAVRGDVVGPADAAYDSERALWWLDQLIDNAILNVARHPVERAELRGLQIAKAYRTAIPTTGSEAAQITAALDRVPAAAPPFLCPLPSGIEVQASGLDRLTQTGRR